MPLDIFSETPIPDVLPDEMQKVIEKLKKSTNKKECLIKAYDILTSKYRWYRILTYLKILDAFENDIWELWKKTGFMHCNNLNYLLRTILIKSNFFTENEIRLRWTLIWYISPHQYTQVKIDDKWVDIDIWWYSYWIKLGDHAHGFH